MPTYFFDFDDGEHPFSDDEGSKLRDVEAAREEAIAFMAEMVRRSFGKGQDLRKELSIRVRDSDETTVLVLTLTLEVKP